MTTICSGTGKHATRSVDGIWMTCPVCGMYTVPYPNGTVRRHGPFQTRRIDAEHKVARLTLEEARLTADLQTVKAERDAMQRRAEAAERDWQYAEAEVLGLTARIDVSAVEIARLTAALQQAQTPEICICAAVRLQDGRIVRGHRHDSCYRTLDGWTSKPDIRAAVQGFVTSHNRFVTRRQGCDLQNAAGLVSAMTQKPIRGILFSEDLYFDSHDRATFDRLTLQPPPPAGDAHPSTQEEERQE